MTDAQHLINYARTQFDAIAADVERHFDQVAGTLKDRFNSSAPLPPPKRRLPPPTTFQQVERWVSRNKALTAAIVAFVVTGSVGTFVYIRSKSLNRKRRARKSASGARTDVVVVAGAVANPLTSALYLDLERRGFVVYVVASTREDEHYVRAQRRADLIPLSLDLSDPFRAQEQLAKLQTLLSRPHVAFDGAEPHKLQLKGLVLVPDTKAAPARVEDITSGEWSDALNAKVLNTIVAAQMLVPAVIEHKANVLMLTPSVTPALRLPMHAIESTVYGALQGFVQTLEAELRQDGVRVSHLKLGHIEIPAVTARQRRDGVPLPKLKPTPLRQLHDTVFDTLTARRPWRTIRAGRGSLAYDLIGSLLPPTFIAWMMGASKRPTIVRDASDESLSASAGSITWEKIEEE
ncbi:UPF0744 protein [Fulvia fulva]|uniref:UPF0744 protein n=1 Tax=Passalora fulva TaxID=5499 RepID=A0A9Q8LCG1_PASFU|nr:UPF0744 protein [Fulvia fulva]KAK4629108.1 UPF0744 protein [Fulvia fulva]KAK4630265.1 UPF0744 protein [Fulvia fulva]UJO14846.1 UPF0744 protein [Fulvia fulva]WPV12617.1 UPF0744 protein [Fulvia fulva]WPV27396.1 UPF0744 protein [Fulvia fulva]